MRKSSQRLKISLNCAALDITVMLDLIMDIIGKNLQDYYTKSKERKRFPIKSKEMNLILSKKNQEPDDMPSTYRLVCLIKLGKVFKKILE